MNNVKNAVLVLALVSWVGLPIHTGAQEPPTSNGDGGRPVRSSWTSDRHMVEVGDVVTILVDEYTLASSRLAELARTERDRDLSLRGGVGMATGVRSVNDVNARTRGESSRTERFSAEVSARVLEVTPGGMIRLEGKRKLQIDQHEQEITIRGWLRVQDLSTQNTVESWRIADAEILYASNGKLGRAGGFWSRIIDLIWP
jgi:flagellar L-ring protein FlgH